ncbi:hypothetical protein Micbo1qcDRAFT_230915 [Microdochium bolleyi]|uniref:C2H2-type domain-containing protein n=1 Tax=Microdochium bolleyi TaxID=196109 RepID=A0A136JEZ0_9PEZI|nr:hypothetical protein Micbo1qcDRAFT_230915 [Microdochium bolleyi]
MPPPLPSPTEGQAPVAYTSKFRLEAPKPPDAGIRPPSDFPSPGRNHAATRPGFMEDVDSLTTKIQHSPPEAVRAAVRRSWQTTLMGSSWHEAFILNMILTTSNNDVISKTVKELAHIVTTGSTQHLIPYFTTADFDNLADQILSRCSNSFLDKALERRLKSIPPRELINALAKAERLGYEQGDVLDDNSERIIGGIPRKVQTTMPSQAPPSTHNPQQPQPPTQQLRCVECGGIFTDGVAYDYHVSNRVCKGQPPGGHGIKYWCPNCGNGFKTKGGLSYHELNKVCGPPRPKPTVPQPHTMVLPPPQPVYSHYAGYGQSVAPPVTQMLSSQVASTPPMARSSADDPYAHLNAATRAKMEEEMREAERKYAPRIKEAEAIEDPAERKRQLGNLHNSFSTRQSGIRKRYGVRLRIRRTRAEIEAQQSRMGISSTQSEADDTPAAKRLRTDTPTSSSVETHAPRVPTAEMSSGLAGTAATPATADPTSGFTSVVNNTNNTNSQGRITPTKQPSLPQAETSNSLGSLQRKGYRVSSHVAQPSSPDRVMSDLGSRGQAASGNASASSASESEDSDDDEEIPAVLPTGNAAK